MAVECGPGASAMSTASLDHSAPQSTATQVVQLASWAPNGWDIMASADNCSNRTSLFFLLTLPFVSCMGVGTSIIGSSAEGPAFFLRWASARAPR